MPGGAPWQNKRLRDIDAANNHSFQAFAVNRIMHNFERFPGFLASQLSGAAQAPLTGAMPSRDSPQCPRQR